MIRRTLHLCLRKLPLFHEFTPSFLAYVAGDILGKLGCFRTFSGFFASSLAIIRLYKLSTLSLRLFPPLKPFERRDHLSDILEYLAYIAMYRLICIAPLVDRSKA
ncbi:MAG: hypothetical protein CL920_37340 [Deltaproteobacteria bacterium]|nr:hypothetical protein [Deltaproteobacteria bacterium]